MVKKFNTLFSFVHSVVKSVHVVSETKDAPQAQSGLHSRLSSQLKACSAAALLAVGGLADADAAVVHWQNANLLIPNTIDGLYINVESHWICWKRSSGLGHKPLFCYFTDLV